jgi:hypothetical protein
MSKARDLLNKLGGSGSLFPKPAENSPLNLAPQSPDHGHASGRPPTNDPKLKNKPTKSGLGSAPTSVRPKV